MSNVNVSISNDLTCVGVHWNTTIEKAIKQFEDWGFRGISNFEKVEVLNGNAARKMVVQIANRQNIRYFFVGNYDWAGDIPHDSAIYRFDYQEYVGNTTSSAKGTERFAGYINRG